MKTFFFLIFWTESGGVWLLDTAASHAGACAEGSSLRDAAKRLSEEASPGRPRSQGRRKSVQTLRRCFAQLLNRPGLSLKITQISMFFFSESLEIIATAATHSNSAIRKSVSARALS